MKQIFLNFMVWLVCSVVGGMLGVLIWEFLVRFKNGCREIAENMEKFAGLKLMFLGLLIGVLAVVTVPLVNLLLGGVLDLSPTLLKWFVWICAGFGLIATWEFVLGLVRYVSAIRHGY